MVKGNAEKSEKKLVSRREFLAGSSAVIAAIALTACGTKTTNSTTPTPTSVPSTPIKQTSTSPSTSTLTPKYGGSLKIVYGTFGGNIGWPADITGGGGQMQVCFETLLRGDTKGNVYPWLAESYKVADDLKSITFNLRQGVKFHDGSDFNAEAVKWNLENYMNAKTQPNWDSVDIIDDNTVRVNFNGWACTLPASFGDADPSTFLVSKASFDKYGKDWMSQNPIGTGPLKFVSYGLDTILKFTRNPDYWVKGKPYLDGLEYVIVADLVTQKTAMQNGLGDIDMNSPPGKTAADLAAMGLDVHVAMDSTCMLIPDTANSDSPWSNQKVREAVDCAIDREGIVKAFGYGYWQAPYQIPARITTAYDPNFSLGRKYNTEKAKQLLDEAGYTGNPRFQTTIIVWGGASRDVIVAVQGNLADVGIQVTLDYPDQAKFGTYLGPPGSWHNAAICMPCPSQGRLLSGDLNLPSRCGAQAGRNHLSWFKPTRQHFPHPLPTSH